MCAKFAAHSQAQSLSAMLSADSTCSFSNTAVGMLLQKVGVFPPSDSTPPLLHQKDNWIHEKRVCHWVGFPHTGLSMLYLKWYSQMHRSLKLIEALFPVPDNAFPCMSMIWQSIVYFIYHPTVCAAPTLFFSWVCCPHLLALFFIFKHSFL